jgi:fatty acid desaturase
MKGAILSDLRDRPLLHLIVRSCVFAMFSASLFIPGLISTPLAILHFVVFVGCFAGPFTLFLHCHAHRPTFNSRFAWLNAAITLWLAPFFGQTPNTYFVHHIGMHHVEENLRDDTSSTLPFQRDSFGAWLYYFAEFLLLGLARVLAYQWRRGRRKLARRLVVGELSFWGAVALLSQINFFATLVVFIIPTVTMRILMMVGNWAQHAFTDPTEPTNPLRSSIVCIDTPYNTRGFNDGYHIIHHLAPTRHFSEFPQVFAEERERLGRADAIVFSGIDFFGVWLLLMFKRYGRLADAFVRLPGAPERNQAAIVALLKSRVARLPNATIPSARGAA